MIQTVVVAVNHVVGIMIYIKKTVIEETHFYEEDDAPFAMSPKDLKLIESIPK